MNPLEYGLGILEAGAENEGLTPSECNKALKIFKVTLSLLQAAKAYRDIMEEPEEWRITAQWEASRRQALSTLNFEIFNAEGRE